MTEKQAASKPVGADLILPVCAALYALYYVWSVWDFPAEAQFSGIMLAGLLLLLVTIYLIRVLRGLASGRYSMGFGDLFGPRESRRNRSVFFCLMLAALVLVPWLGFTLTTFSFLASSFIALGVRPFWRAVQIAAVGGLVGWFFFIFLLGTHFPKGPFELLVEALI
ncbi:tripartite tricarboxylate transporter TctB family protein [Paracoccus onubensis]|uniref:tripartite tricarboxylate transporter TctB family protein n=1 Tax=Paracoccus onubensis TaxID=1675788 RepID=UPI00273091BA|nr:tripartite tricarboxylate transporter TctB family protein [Paracoccus onubensis]MDP0929563.1 tripartite tricarboxylate transporter TctB family protein [Paracoccus onubensis]